MGGAWFNTMNVLVLHILYTLQNRPTLSKITLSNHLYYSLLCRPKSHEETGPIYTKYNICTMSTVD